MLTRSGSNGASTMLSMFSSSSTTWHRHSTEQKTWHSVIDYLYNIITLTKSEKELDERIERLAKRGLFPLPEADYTAKYKMFRRMVKSKMGRKLMLRTLPLLT